MPWKWARRLGNYFLVCRKWLNSLLYSALEKWVLGFGLQCHCSLAQSLSISPGCPWLLNYSYGFPFSWPPALLLLCTLSKYSRKHHDGRCSSRLRKQDPACFLGAVTLPSYICVATGWGVTNTGSNSGNKAFMQIYISVVKWRWRDTTHAWLIIFLNHLYLT